MTDDMIITEQTRRRGDAQARLATLDGRDLPHRALFETIDDGFTIVECIVDQGGIVVDWTWLEANQAFESQSGMTDVVGWRASERLPGDVTDFTNNLTRAITMGKTIRADEDYSPDLGRWFRAHYARVGGLGSVVATVRFEDVTSRKHRETALLESEERQKFLLAVADAIKPLTNPVQIRETASRMLGERLQTHRVSYGEVVGSDLVVESNYVSGVQPIVGRFPFASSDRHMAEMLRAGETVVSSNVLAEAWLTESDRQSYVAMQIAGMIGYPLIKNGAVVAVFGIHHATTRRWTDNEVQLTGDVAERLWDAIERAHTETALRESEARFQQFADASSGALWIRDASTLTMEFTSRAINEIYGLSPEALLGPLELWAKHIVPDDRALALEHIYRARNGESVTHEFRIQRPSDLAFRWIRDTDFPLYDASGAVQRIGGIAEDVTATKLLKSHQAVLLAELQHRVRNIMAVIRSITARTAHTASSVNDYAATMSGRLLTLARVQALLTRAANAGVDLGSIVRSELGAGADQDHQYEVSGPDIVVAPKAAEVLTLALHELTTNAVKYGALSAPGGFIRVTWDRFDRRGAPWLGLDWQEDTPWGDRQTKQPQRRGFGTEMIEGRIPYELGGRGHLKMGPTGLYCHLEFPLQGGASILETDAPASALVFGGTLDMTGEADLSGHRILVIEDDYYLASDTAAALRGAGAEIMGPFPSEQAVLEGLAASSASAAVVDINLGDGPSFALSHTLRQRGIPFVFITGYDDAIIHPEFMDVPRLQKPVDLRAMVAAIAQTVGIKHS